MPTDVHIVCLVMCAGSIVFGIFRSRTSGHYFKEDVVSGGAA